MWSDSWQPDSYVDKIDRNLLHGNHTLCLLGTTVTLQIWYYSYLAVDIKMKEQSIENLMK